MRHPTTRTLKRSWWVLRHALRRWPGLVMLLAATGTQMLVALLLPWPLKILVDNVLLGQPLPPTLDAAFAAVGVAPSQQGLLYLAVGATVVLFVIFSATDFATRLSTVSYGQRLTYDVASELFERMQRLSQRADRRTASGDMLRRVTQDSACVSDLVAQALVPTIFAAISLVLMLAIMIDLDSRLAVIAVAIAPLMVLANVRYMMPMADRGYEREEAEAAIYTVSERALTANPIVQVFAREDLEDARFRVTTAGALEATLRLTSVQLRFKTWLGLLLATGSAAVLWVGATTVLGGGLTVGAMLVFFAYLTTMYGSLQTIAYSSATVGEATGSLRRVAEVLDAPPEIVERPGAPVLPPVRGHVRIEGVVFGYEPGRAVLRGVRFEARPGETVALVGASGAGKSTLASLVPRLVDPWLGRVTIDGHDVREVSLRSVREQVAVVLQEPFLFPITIAENIAYGRPGASRGDIEAAAGAADAHGFIERLPAGYETIVGERGATLSGGERQRLSIARALLKDAPILVLDEPTSALDAGTEITLLRALERLMADRTTLVIAHRLSTVRRADRIVVLHEGRVAEIGTHDELLAAGGLYAYLYRTQFRDDDDGLGSRPSGMLVLA